MGQKPKILVADDEDFIRKLSTKILSMGGYEVIQAENGNQALDMYHDNQDTIELVILDIRMPGKSGLEVFQTLISENPFTRVILCSGFGEYEIPPDSGCFYVQKPFSVNGLLEVVEKVMNFKKEEIAEKNEKAKNLKLFEE